ncbi:MAG: bifunctional 4-hydroxy-2-oxoglutarate aldolase/2-dehydro-3-deoxy-phosphogluconate aldolase [Acidimicrobiales bacterium]
MTVLETMSSDRVVAVIRAPRIADPRSVAETLAAAGIRCIEFTFTTDGVLEAIEKAAPAGAVIGAGTVTTAAQARDAIAAGARFVVSPALVPEIAPPCREAGVPFFLAALTPTEVVGAIRAGTEAVKLFPAGLGGPRYLRDLLGPLPATRFIPSGGIDETNARAWLDAGAVAVFVGSKLAPANLVASGEHGEIGRRAEALVRALGER